MATLRGLSILTIAFMVVFTGGCATHAPVSESAMFHAGTTRPSHDETFGFGFFGTASSTREIALDIARQKDYPDDWTRRNDVALNPNRLSGGLYVSKFDSEGRYAVAGVLGIPVAGVDATVQLWKRNYVTASFSAPKGAQFFLQHRTYNSAQLGIAVGLGYRRDSFSLSAPCAGALCFDLETKEANSIGAKGFAVFRAKGDTGGGIKVGTYGGYVPTLESPLFSISLTVGGF